MCNMKICPVNIRRDGVFGGKELFLNDSQLRKGLQSADYHFILES